MIVALLWLLFSALSGTLLTCWYLEQSSILVRLIGGACSGFVLSALLGYGAASVCGLGALSQALTGLILLVPFVQLRSASVRERLGRDCRAAFQAATLRRRAPLLACGLLLLPILVIVFSHAIFSGPDGIYTYGGQNLGDLPMHVGLSTSFFPGQNIPPEDIEFSGVRMPYPFLVDFQTAQLYAMGAPIVDGMACHNVLMALTFFAMVLLWGYAFSGQRRAAVLTPWFVMLSGGAGFLAFLQDCHYSVAEAWAMLPHLNVDYTIRATGLRWGNSIVCLLITQRGLLLGLPLMMWCVYLLWRSTALPRGPARVRLCTAAGILTACIVLAQSYVAVVTAGMGVLLAFTCPEPAAEALTRTQRRQGRSMSAPSAWLCYGLTATLLALPQGLWLVISSGMRSGSFLAWSLGWDHGSQNPITFWLVNTGILLPMLVVGYLHDEGGEARRRARFYAPFLLCFMVPNLVRLAPWIWDNIKILYPWFLFSVPWAGMAVARISRMRPAGWLLAAALALLLTASGALDVWRVVSGAAELKVFDGEGVAFGEALRRAIPPHARVLHAPTYDSSIYLSGAISVLGYTGHVVSRGIDLGSREKDQATIYAGQADAWDLLARYHVDYVLVGPQERAQYRVNDAFFERFVKVADWRGYRLYQIPHI